MRQPVRSSWHAPLCGRRNTHVVTRGVVAFRPDAGAQRSHSVDVVVVACPLGSHVIRARDLWHDPSAPTPPPQPSPPKTCLQKHALDGSESAAHCFGAAAECFHGLRDLSKVTDPKSRQAGRGHRGARAQARLSPTEDRAPSLERGGPLRRECWYFTVGLGGGLNPQGGRAIVHQGGPRAWDHHNLSACGGTWVALFGSEFGVAGRWLSE